MQKIQRTTVQSKRRIIRRKRRRKAAPNTENQELPIGVSNIQQMGNPAAAELTPQRVMYLQRTIGNQATQRLIIQRNPMEDKLDTATEVMDPIGNVGSQGFDAPGHKWTDWSFKPESSDPNKVKELNTGEKVSSGGAIGMNTFGLITNTMGLVSESSKTHRARQDMSRFKTEGSSRYEQAKRSHSAGAKGVAEKTTGIAQNIYGIVTASLQIAEKLTNFASSVLGAISGGLGIITGLVGTIRDSINIHKRRKRKGQIAQLINSYESIERNLQSQITTKKQEQVSKNQEADKIKEDIKKIKDPKKDEEKVNNLKAKAKKLAEDVKKLQDDVGVLEGKVQTYAGKAEKVAKALGIAKRKQGSGAKVVSLITNIASTGLGALGIAAAITGAAALGPVGWIIGGVLLVTTLGLLIGTKVKQAIRASNVERMKQEHTKLNNFVQNGPSALPGSTASSLKALLKKKHAKKTGTDSELAKYLTTADAGKRRDLLWYRNLFPTAENKGWFNRFLSTMIRKRGHSGKTTIGERLDMLQEYLDKFDKDSAANTTWQGIMEALTNPEEGSLDVDNPKFDSKKPEDERTNPKTIKLKDHIRLMIITFYPKRGDKIIQDIIDYKSKDAAGTATQSDTEKMQSAKALILEKLKLQDK